MDALSLLLKKGFQWEWTSAHEEAFNKAGTALSKISELTFYDTARPTALHVTDGRGRRVVQADLRFSADPETRYAMIQLECLAASSAIKKCRQVIEGLPSFELVTDHKPLVLILNKYSLDKLDNPRLLRLRLRMQQYAFTIRWVPGKANVDADNLSRTPANKPKRADQLAEGPPSFSARIALISAIYGLDPKLSTSS